MHVILHPRLVLSGGDVSGVLAIVEFRHGVDECAPSEVRIRQALSESVEDRERTAGRVAMRMALDGALEPFTPALVSTYQIGPHQLLLGTEARVQRHLRHAGICRDPIDTGRSDPLLIEELRGGIKDPIGRGLAGHVREVYRPVSKYRNR